jgi:hypothetical protein
MPILRTLNGTIDNDNLPPVLTGDAAEVYDIIAAHVGGWWSPIPAAQSRGNWPAAAYAWRDMTRMLALASSDTTDAIPAQGVAPNHLKMGYGSGLTSSVSGALEMPDGAKVFNGPNVSFVSVFRVDPGLAGGGGTLIGNMLNQGDRFTIDAVGNNRFTGLQVGYGSSSTKELRFMLNGDVSYYVNPAGNLDHMDGQWHVAFGIFDDAAQLLTLRLDGAVLATQSTFTTIAHHLSTIAGHNSIRIGANGLPGAAAASLTNRWVGDIGDQMVIGGAVPTSDEIAIIETYLLGIYG